MITLRELSVSRNGIPLLEQAAATVYPGQKVGLIGRNGCGKSTLFAVIRGEIPPDAGSVERPADLTVAAVSQQIPDSQRPALDYVIDGDTRLRDLERRRDAAVAAGDGEAQATLVEQLDLAGAWTVTARAGILLHGLGFDTAEIRRPVNTFSGGWRMRLNLARALLTPTELLLLDEPTNHLDLDTIVFLERYLTKYRHAVICISHDRAFLDAFTDHIIHIDHGRLVMYAGNYSAFERQRAERIRAERHARRREEQVLAGMRDFVARFRYKATKARQAQSLIKAMERMQLTAVTREESPLSFTFPAPARTPATLFTCDDVDVGYDPERPILTGVKLSLYAGDRVGLLGRNGQGKSTLIKTVAGLLPPLRRQIARAPGLTLGYFAQHETEVLRPELSPLDELRALAPRARELELRSFLGTYAFSGDQVLRPIKTLSGGEQARLALALLAYRRPNLLLLDEPTNHLDLDTREALSVALTTYPGALILVSHDRYLLETTVDKLWWIRDGQATEFAGDLNAYRAALAADRPAEATGAPPPSTGLKRAQDLRRQAAAQRARLRPLRQEIDRAEQEAAGLQKELAELDQQLSSTATLIREKPRLGELFRRRAAVAAAVAAAEAKWYSLQEQLEALQTAAGA